MGGPSTASPREEGRASPAAGSSLPAEPQTTVEHDVRAEGGPESEEPVKSLLEDLAALLPEQGEERRLDELLAAHDQGELDDPALAEALRARLDRDPDLALELVRMLSHVPSRQALFLAVRALAPHSARPDVREGLAELLAHGTEEERELVPFAFLGTSDPEALVPLSRIFTDPRDRPSVRAAAGYVLAGSWDAVPASDREKARSAALSAATDLATPRALRRESLEVLAASGVTAPERARLETLAASERDPGVRLLCLRVLHPDSPEEPVRELPEEVLRELGRIGE